MRIRGCWFPVLLFSATLSACASAPPAPPARDISGAWYGTMEDRGLQLSLLLHLSRDAAGNFEGSADSPNQLDFDQPLKSVALEGQHFSATIESGDGDGEAVFSGSLDADGHQIAGRLKQGKQSLPLTLKNVDPSTLKLQRPRSLNYSIAGRSIHYMQMDGPAHVRVVFIHGTPGEWQGWSEYLGDPELQRRATLIAVDRPGFGQSKGEVVPDMREQARLLEPLLRGPEASASDKANPLVTTIVVGHSLGGPIAAELAMDYPDEVQGALLIAPSIDPATEAPRWYNEAMTWSVVNALVSTFMDPALKGANQELMPLSEQLKIMEPRWKSLTMPVTVIQGEKDDLVDPRTADFAERVLPHGDRVIRVPDEGHFVLWEKPQIEVQALLDLLDRSAANGSSQAQAGNR